MVEDRSKRQPAGLSGPMDASDAGHISKVSAARTVDILSSTQSHEERAEPKREPETTVKVVTVIFTK